jgi:putative DNA methylase
MIGNKLTVIAWLWVRTVKSPNPAFAEVEVPLASTFVLSTKEERGAYIEPVIEGDHYRFTVRLGKPKNAEIARNGTKLARGANFQCLMSGTPIAGDYIKAEGMAGRIGARLMAAVVESERGRAYLAPTPEQEAAALKAEPTWRPDVEMSGSTQYLGVKPYGMTQFAELFTARQLVALTSFSDLVQEARELVKGDALVAGIRDDGHSLKDNGAGAQAYADAVCMYLGFALSKAADRNSALCVWENSMDRMRGTFGRQVIPMVWDYVETNPFAGAGGDIYGTTHSLCEVLDQLFSANGGHVAHSDARIQTLSRGKVVSTDPPYYDNVPYADLSDFFYVWLRRSLKSVFPDLFATMAVPKAEELVAFAYRHASKNAASSFFMDGMTSAMHRLADNAHPAFPITIYYAFKQSETEKDGTASTGWETFLDGVITAGLGISGTWPMRSELATRNIGRGNNALASSIILVCRRRAANEPTTTRREFLTALKNELPEALKHLQCGNIAPVDLAQAAIGPGMAVYTRYARVLDADGETLTVREALALINQTLDEALAEQEGDFDADSRWALAWFEQYGFDAGEYGVAETLSKAKNTSVSGMVAAGLLTSKAGKVRLLRPDELPTNWDPETDPRLTAWESVHHLVRLLEAGGENAAADLVAKLGGKAEIARELAYRLYTLCERKKRAQEALSYNGLVQSWPEIMRLAREGTNAPAAQTQMFSEG